MWNNPGVGRVELGTNHTRWVSEATRLIDYVVFEGDSYPEIMERYADATGHSPEFPEWSSGFWQCKLRYESQEELLSVAREYKERGLPISVIVIDYMHWTKMGDWKFDPKYWPDPKGGMVDELETMGIKLMVSIWPAVNPDSENYPEMKDKGLLINTERGINNFFEFVDANTANKVFLSMIDTTNSEARSYIWDKVKKNYYDFGIKTWWLDAIEPDMSVYSHDNMRYAMGNGMEVGCFYPFGQQEAFYEGMKNEGEDEIITLCRSAFAGSQRYGAAVWSGDIHSTFDVLRTQVKAGLNMGMSGIPWWTTDIGGFSHGDVESEYFKELLVRWFQYGVFCPIFRLHGWRWIPGEEPDYKSGGPNEVWSFGEDNYEIIKEYMFMRERLRPYIMEHMKLASDKGTPVMRPMFFLIFRKIRFVMTMKISTYLDQILSLHQSKSLEQEVVRFTFLLVLHG